METSGLFSPLYHYSKCFPLCDTHTLTSQYSLHPSAWAALEIFRQRSPWPGGGLVSGPCVLSVGLRHQGLPLVPSICDWGFGSVCLCLGLGWCVSGTRAMIYVNQS